MRIEEDVKLDFKDVLIKPKRSTLKSRSDVDLRRTIYMPHSKMSITSVPLIAANMDTVATFTMAKVLAKHQCMTALHKHYSVDELVHFWLNENDDVLDNVFYSIGITDIDLDKFNEVNKLTNGKINKICIDVANGYSQYFVEFVSRFREANPGVTIMAGNVVTAEMTEELIIAGVDIVKAGIGPGCFLAGTLVETVEGKKPIETIKNGDIVQTHTLAWRKVTNTFIHTHHTKGLRINDTNTTPNHEFYVLHKKFKDIVTDDTINEYAEWICADDLNSNYLLIKRISEE